MIGFDLLRPSYVWAFAFTLMVGLIWLIGRRTTALEAAALVDATRLRAFLPGFSRRRGLVRGILVLTSLVLVSWSLLGPVRGWTERDVAQKGLDLVVCLDTSRSMLAADLTPDRLTRAKREVRGLLDELEGDRMALIAFSGDAREVTPLTRDRASLRGFLDSVEVGDNRKGGTDLAVALEAALALFDGRTGAHEGIVVLTDGEDLEGRGLEVAEEASDRGIRVFVVGIGTEGGAKIPIIDERGGTRFLTDKAGNDVVTRLDGSTLERLAESTGGAYLSTENAALPLETLYRSRISRLEGREDLSGKRKVPHDRYQWFALVALVLLAVELSVGERGKERIRTT